MSNPQNRSSMKNLLLTADTGMLLFCLLLTLEPILGHSDVYWYLMSFLVLIGFFVLIGFIIGVFKRKVSIPESLARLKKTSYLYFSVFIVGLIISFAYHSSMYKFWLSIFVIELVVICCHNFKTSK
jgi:hypothetical protein